MVAEVLDADGAGLLSLGFEQVGDGGSSSMHGPGSETARVWRARREEVEFESKTTCGLEVGVDGVDGLLISVLIDCSG